MPCDLASRQTAATMSTVHITVTRGGAAHMAKQDTLSVPSPSEQPVEIDLRNPALAALLAWLWPGAGHLYQRRKVKGVLFMVCVLATYFFGLVLGEGHVVYASWLKSDRRWQYLCQVGVGLPALPALVQNRLVRSGKEPLLGGIMHRRPRFWRIRTTSWRDGTRSWAMHLTWGSCTR